jgi:hypothetical protein
VLQRTAWKAAHQPIDVRRRLSSEARRLLVVRNPTPAVRKVLEIAGVSQLGVRAEPEG